MTWNTVTVERQGEIAIVGMAREKYLNAFDREMTEELAEVGRSFHSDHDTHAVILTGTGRKKRRSPSSASGVTLAATCVTPGKKCRKSPLRPSMARR